MTPIVVVPPAFEPVSWAEAQVWTNALDSDEELVTGLISAAREFCEHRKGYAFYEQTLEVVTDRWPAYGRLALPRATPLQSIVSVTYTDADGAGQTVSDSAYRLNTAWTPGGMVFMRDFDRPALDEYAPNPIVIRYVAGSNTSPLRPVSASIKLAMRLLIAHWYRNREAVIVAQSASVAASELPVGVDALLGVDQQIFAF